LFATSILDNLSLLLLEETNLRLPILAFALALMFSTGARAEANCGVPNALSDGWTTATAVSVGIAPDTLCRLTHDFSARKDVNIHSILIARHGKLVFEQYYTGSDQKWGNPASNVTFGPTVPHDLRSITKSVVSLLLGIGIEKGWVHSIDQPVLSFFPEYADLQTPEKNSITLRDLLTMTSGLTWNEDLPYGLPGNSETQMDLAQDPCRFVLEQPVAQPRGMVWTYSGGGAALIARVLHKATGQTIDQLARTHLFEPLDISNVEWARYPLTKEPVAASGLRLLPRDTIKIGQLVLDKGVWHGRQVVPVAWINQAAAPQVNGPGVMFYGFQFWLGRSLVGGREVQWIAGVGYGGQRLFIVPSLDLVVLVHAGLYDSRIQDWIGYVLLNRYVLPGTTP
jgi:CubicO group peptidase (beta-lactamase class C family)